MIKALSPVQAAVLEFISGFVSTHGYPPTIRNISDKFGYRTPAGAHYILEILQDKGYIRREPQLARSITVVESAPFDNLAQDVMLALEIVRTNGEHYCVNWADLHCVNILAARDREGATTWQVYLQGANEAFCGAVEAELCPKWGSIIVRMKW